MPLECVLTDLFSSWLRDPSPYTPACHPTTNLHPTNPEPVGLWVIYVVVNVCALPEFCIHTVWVIRFCSGVLEAGRPSLGLFFCVCGGLANLWISFQGSCITSTQPSVYSLTHALFFIPSAFSAFLFFVSLQPLSLRNIVCFLITCAIFCTCSIWNLMLKFRLRPSILLTTHTNEFLLLFILIKIFYWCCCLCNLLHSHGLYQGEGKNLFCWK